MFCFKYFFHCAGACFITNQEVLATKSTCTNYHGKGCILDDWALCHAIRNQHFGQEVIINSDYFNIYTKFGDEVFANFGNKVI